MEYGVFWEDEKCEQLQFTLTHAVRNLSRDPIPSNFFLEGHNLYLEETKTQTFILTQKDKLIHDMSSARKCCDSIFIF